jgi:hypothetical protein
MINSSIFKSDCAGEKLVGETDIQQFFIYFEKNDFHVYRLNGADTESFLDAIKEEARKYYILDSELAEKSEEIGIGKSEFLEQYVLPSVGKIKSGDFGEIFSCFFVKEHYAQKGFILVCPRKFIWKMDRDKAMPFTDVVGFYREDIAKASSNDFIVSVESKMKATYSPANRIQEAIDGAQTDRTTRLAKTLIWLKQKYAREGNVEMHKFTVRYSDPVYQGTYNKIYKAFTIVDSKFEKTEIERPVNNNDGITIIVISMDNLKNIYESNLKKIAESA